MNASTKSRTSVAKFEEFFATTYKDDVFEILEKYPDERSLTVDYNDLEMFDLVGFAVAMGDGKDELKERANLITGTIEEQGIQAVLDPIMQAYV